MKKDELRKIIFYSYVVRSMGITLKMNYLMFLVVVIVVVFEYRADQMQCEYTFFITESVLDRVSAARYVHFTEDYFFRHFHCIDL